jgi:hypothetical protein
MAAKPRKSAVQNIIKNLLETEIPDIQTASKELAEWIKQLEQHSFKLQHYATEIETWASEEEEVDSIELTDLIKDLEATLTDMRVARTLVVPDAEPEPLIERESTSNRMLRTYGRSGKTLKEPKALPKVEFKELEEKPAVKQVEQQKPVAPEVPKKEPVRTPQGVLVAKDSEKPRVKAEFPTGGKETVAREAAKAPQDKEEEDTQAGYMTPEGFLIRRLRP